MLSVNTKYLKNKKHRRQLKIYISIWCHVAQLIMASKIFLLTLQKFIAHKQFYYFYLKHFHWEIHSKETSLGKGCLMFPVYCYFHFDRYYRYVMVKEMSCWLSWPELRICWWGNFLSFSRFSPKLLQLNLLSIKYINNLYLNIHEIQFRAGRTFTVTFSSSNRADFFFNSIQVFCILLLVFIVMLLIFL